MKTVTTLSIIFNLLSFLQIGTSDENHDHLEYLKKNLHFSQFFVIKKLFSPASL